MQIPPASVLSTWPAPNYVNPETRGPSAIITVSVLLGLVTLLLVARIYTRVYISRGFGLDDVFILLAYVPTAAFGIISIVAQLKYGWGKHVWDVSFALFQPGLQINLASQLLFALATTLTKLSMLALIYRVVSVDKSRYRYVVLGVSCVVALDGLIFFFVSTFQCSPVSAYWTLSVTPQRCINESTHILAAGCINTSTDFLIVLLPIPYVVRLQLPRKQQIIVGSLFAGGVFVTAAGAVRTFVMFDRNSDVNKDMTWNSVPIIIASALELYIGIICASIPSIKPFFARYLPRLIGKPKYWLSRPNEIYYQQQRGAAGELAANRTTQNSFDKNFWLVTAANDHEHDAAGPWSPGRPDSPLVMQMHAAPVMPGMPTPTRPPRTPSTLRSIPSLYRPRTNSTWASAAPSPTTYTMMPAATSPTTASYYETTALLQRQASFDKPLPRIPSATRRAWLDLAEDDSRASMAAPSPPLQNNNMLSVYQFIPHDDGHISVVRTRGHHDMG